MSFSIDGKTVIVTGAANGIGAALARHFAENGAKVMCADIDEKSLKKDLGETAEDSNVSCLLYTSPSPRDGLLSRMPSSA